MIQRPTRETPARGIALIAASLVVLVVIPLVIRLVRPGGYWLTGSQTAAVQVEWSPNGTQLAFLEPPQRAGMESFFWGFTDYGESTLRVQKGNRPSELASFEGANASVGGRAVVWGGDRHVAFTTTDHPARIAIADVTTGGPPSLLDGANPSFSPDGRKLVYEKRQARKSRSYERDLHDGTMVRDYRDKWELYVYELATGTESQLTRGGGRSPLWSPDGATIVFERDDYTVKSQSWVDHRRDAERKYNTTSRKIWKSKQLMAVPSYGGLEWVIAEHGVNRFPQFVGENGEALSWVHWDPPQKKGRRIYGDDEWGEHGYADADARFTEAKLMWSAVDGSGKEELLSFATDAVALDTARWTRDGRYLLYTGLTFDRSKLVMNPSMQLYASDFEDKVDLFRFEPATGQRVRLRPSEKHPVRTHPVPSPDGTRLAFRIMRGGIPQVKVVRFSSLEPH